MESNGRTSFIVICGVFILVVFAYVATLNLLPDNLKSEAYYAKIDKDMIARIEDVSIKDGSLTISTSGESNYYCVKATKSTPMENSLCWSKIENNSATMSIFAGKKYYIWIKDSNNRISSPKSI